LALATLAGAATAAQGWDVSSPGQPYRDVEFTVQEGTWMSVDASPDGQLLVFDLLGDIFTLPVNGGEARLVQGGPAMQRTPRFSADGRQLLFVSDASGAENVWISDIDGSNARAVTHETRDLIQAANWGPDQRSVVASFIPARHPMRLSAEIKLYEVGGGSRTLVPVPANKRDVAEPEMSPDGQYVYYTERLTTPNIYIDANHINYAVKRRDVRTGESEELASGWGAALAPQVSKSGKHLAFVRRVKDKTVLFHMDLTTRAQRAVYDGLDRDLQASYEAQVNYFPGYAWFPDEKHIAIWAQGKLMKVDVETGAATPIPFRARIRQRIVEPVRFEQDLAPAQVQVRAVRDLAVSPDEKVTVFTALNRLWRRAGSEGKSTPFGRPGAAGFEPAFARDGKRVVYVEWDDERGSALNIANENGKGLRTIATSRGVIRQPQFSADGKRVTFRIQAADVSMGGARAKPGIYWVEAAGGEAHFIAEGDDAPQFSPDGQRVYFVVSDYSGASVAQSLRSATLDGLDIREHARTPNADTTDMRASPDLRWIAFRDRQQYFVVPYRETGAPLRVSANTTEVAATKLTSRGGYALTWSTDSKSLHWALGPALYRAAAPFANASGSSLGSINLSLPLDVPRGTVAFTHATIVTMRGDEVIDDGTVVVTGNRIAAIGPSASVAIPAGAKVIDAAGKTILPGLIDAHGHIDCCYGTGTSPQKQASRYAALAFGVTTNFDPYPNELTSYESTETTLAGLSVGPRWIGTGGALWGRSEQASNLFEPIETLDDARNVMARKRAIGGTIVKSYRYPARRERQLLIAAGREAGIMVDIEGESQFYNNITAVIDGHTNLEHNLPVANYYDDIVQLFAQAKVHNTPTLVVNFGELFGENYMYQHTEAWKDPRIQMFVQETLSGYSPLGTPYGAPPYARAMNSINVADELWEIGFRSVARSTAKLDAAGVVINVGSHGEVPGLAIHWEMRLLSQGGMSSMRILHAATINGARTLGIDRQIGSLEPGKLADLIVLDRNPLQNIANTDSVRLTMVNGRLYDSMTMNETGNYDRPRTRFYWELQQRNGIDWNEAWGGR
jgi:Tol biopolymer transport system component